VVETTDVLVPFEAESDVDLMVNTGFVFDGLVAMQKSVVYEGRA